MAAAEPSQGKLLSERLQRFGVVGAGVIPDSLGVLRAAEAKGKEEAATPSASGPPAAFAPPDRVALEPAGARGPETVDIPGGKTLTRQQILEILAETVRVQGIVQQEVSQLARKFAKEAKEAKEAAKEAKSEKGEDKKEKGEDKKKKSKRMTFVDGHKQIQELDLPKEPLEDFGLSENAFQKVLLQYSEDEEVMMSAQMLLHPSGKGDAKRAEGITMDKIVDIHKFMVGQMQKVLEEFMTLPREVRRTFTGKGCETTAELLVSIAVEQSLNVRCEDVEQAVIRYEEQLQTHHEFARCTEQLANMMQHLIGAAQPRIEKDMFVKMLKTMGDGVKNAKAFEKKLYEDYRSKTLNIEKAYERFEEFIVEVTEQARADGEECPELSPVELQLCWEEYREDEEVKKAWETSGVESNMQMQAQMSMMGPPGAIGGALPGSSSSSKSGEDKKGGKKKPNDIIEMQELMVDELKRTTEAVTAAISKGSASSKPWRADLAIQMCQALASGAVERRFGVSAEEMTLTGFQMAATLQKSERFVRATEKQQELLTSLGHACCQAEYAPG